MDTPSLADIAAVTNNDDSWGGSGGWWIIVLFLIMFGGNWFNRGQTTGEPVTEAGLCNAMNFNNLENAVGRLSDQNTQQTAQIESSISNLGYEELKNVNGLQQQVSECCCTTQRAIDGVNYNGAMNTASINANTTEQVQKVLDAITANRMAEMQNQINQLQLSSALCGVVRYPNATTYAAMNNPYFGSGCGCGTTF